MRRRHAPPPAHPFYIYIFKQHTPCNTGQRKALRQEPSLPKITLSTLVQDETGTVHQTAPGGTLYGDLEPIVNETDLIFVPTPKHY